MTAVKNALATTRLELQLELAQRNQANLGPPQHALNVAKDVRSKVREALTAGKEPLEVARTLGVSLVAVAEIAAEDSTEPFPKKRLPPLRGD